jgi:amino acid adenylation domain-containing protein/non-ribosomal peptide synthase protein (TIGR01720 family)
VTGNPHLAPAAPALDERADPAFSPRFGEGGGTDDPRDSEGPGLSGISALSIGGAQVEEVYPPTPMQEGMLLHARMAPGSGIDLVQYVFTLRGSVDAAALRRAWELVLGRHPALRTAFAWSGAERPRQVVHRTVPLPWEEADWRALAPAARDERLAAWLREDRARGFDPARPPLLRVLLARVEDGVWRLVWTHHHLLLDGWSAPLVLGEVLAACAAETRGEAPALPARRPFGDYVAWLEAHDPARAEAFWRAELAGFAAPTPPPPGWPDAEGGEGVLEARLPAVLTAELRSLGRRCGVTLGTLAQGAWALVLAGCSGEDDVVFGAAVSGRPAELEGVEEMVGMFVNTVPVRARLSPAAPAAAWLAELQARAGAAREHEHAPLAEVQRWSAAAPGEPLFRTLLAVENYPVDEAAAARAGFAVEVDEVASRTGFPLTLTVIPGARLRARLRWDGARFGRGDGERILGWFQSALEAIARAPDAPLSSIQLLSGDERRVLEEWNRTAADVPRDVSIPELFARQAACTPDAPAVAYGNERLTFAELHAAANRLARVLRRRGVGPEVRVAVCLERGTDAVAALLGVLAAGGAYVPLDPANPPERLVEMLADSGAAVLVVREHLFPHLSIAAERVLCLDAAADEIAAESADALPGGADPANLAYVIYTSGSTGRPKGVMVEHRSVVNLAALLDRAVYDAWGDAAPAVSLNGPLSFDTSVKQWVRLLSGSTVHVIPDDVRLDGRELAVYVREHRIGVLDCTPAQLRLLLDAGLADASDFPGDVLVAGEALDAATWGRLRESRGPRFHNLYGPTECTVDAAVASVRGASSTPVIGRPGANVRLYVADPWGRPVPVSVPGELWIGGAGVARGYLGRPAATAERFVPDPFSGEPGARLYRSGDRARWLPSGELEFLGRLDHQVKIRGYRIEPGEVEAALLRCPGVREAAVVAREDAPGERRLVAYVAGEGEAGGEGPDGGGADAIRARLRGLLPDYLLPSAIVRLDALPRTGHGKVDRVALPAPEGRVGDEAGYLLPRTPAEAGIAAIWQEVLGTGPAGATDDFFLLGGHSLHAARVASRIREAFGVELPLRACFEARTLAELAQAVEAAAGEDGGGAPPLVPVPRGGDLPLSFAQARLWYLDQLEPGSAAYNMATALRLRGALDAAALRGALGDLVRRHEALRTVFPAPDGAPVQTVLPPSPVPLPEVDLRALPVGARDAELRRRARAEAARPFDLARGPLLRATLIRLGDEDQAILFTLHHIVSDGWSTGVLVREVSQLYAARRASAAPHLPPLPVQYADYAVWQRAWLRDEVLERELAWWRGALADAPALLALPTDRPRPPVQGRRGASIPLSIPRATAERVRAHAARAGATPFMLLLAAWQALLARYAGVDDVLVGTPVAGRTRREVEALIGLFVNTLVVRTDLSGGATFRALLGRVREAALGAFQHQELPFEKLVDELRLERAVGHAPLVQVMFVLRNEAREPVRLAGVEAERLDVGEEPAKFDLALSLGEEDGPLVGALSYRPELFDAATAARMAGHFRALLEQVAAAPERPLAELSLLDDAERDRLLAEWSRGPAAAAPAGCCVHDLVAAQAGRTPGARAVAAEDATLTYAELDAAANRLAHVLRALGVGPEARVAVLLAPGAELAAAQLAVWKAGGAYLPLDPEHPPERLAWVLADAGAAVVVSRAGLAERFPATEAQTLLLDRDAARIAGAPADAPRSGVAASNLAYVIYTSGSTGTPKGVGVSHASLANLLRVVGEGFGWGPDDVVPVLASSAFDIWFFEAVAPLLRGACVRPVPRARVTDARALGEALAGATRLHAVPSLMRALLAAWQDDPAALPRLDGVYVGGEAVPPELLEAMRRAWPAADVRVLYGPTEATILAASSRVDGEVGAWRRVGRPLGGACVYVLDGAMRPQPPGIPGELHLGGAGVARGYLGRPGLTAEKFLPDPFAAEPGARMYRTGDRVRWRPDGELEFRGRADRQVKVRGFRIEPGEIEAVLCGHPEVDEALVEVRGAGPEEARLVAYVVPHDPGAPPAAPALRADLEARLPAYMVPAAFVYLERVPLTPNGKVDRRALPEPAWGGDGEGYEAPRTPVEHLLARAWAEVLRVERVGLRDHFFDLGGDSILSIQVVARARREGVRVTPRQIVEHPTLGELARVAGRVEREAADGALPAGEIPLTPIQHDFFERGAGNHAHWNQALLLAPRRPLHPAPLAYALAGLLDHHDALRLRFAHGGDGAWTQRYAEPGGPVPLVTVDLSALPAPARAARLEAAAAVLQASLDLGRGPLLHAARFDLGCGGERLLLVIHHLAVDGVSWRVLLEDLQRLYEQAARGEAARLAPKTTSFGGWARRLAQHAASGAPRGEAEYWTAPARLEAPRLPVDHPDGANRAGSVRHAAVGLDAEETRALLQDANAAYGTQARDLLLAALARTLGEWTGERRALVHLEGHGREELFPDVDLSRTVGWFTSLFPVLLDLRHAYGQAEELKTVKEQLRAVPANGIGYGLLRYLSPDEELRRALRALPAPEISFNYLGQFDGTFSDSALFSLARESAGPPHAPGARRAHLLDVTAAVEDGVLQARWSYSPDVHRPETVDALAARWLAALRSLIAHCLSADAGGNTPSDFPLAGLDAETLALLEEDFA